MIYNKTHIALLNLTEELIDNKRLWLITSISTCQFPNMIIYLDRFWLPFLIDIMDQYEIEMAPGQLNNTVFITIKNI